VLLVNSITPSAKPTIPRLSNSLSTFRSEQVTQQAHTVGQYGRQALPLLELCVPREHTRGQCLQRFDAAAHSGKVVVGLMRITVRFEKSLCERDSHAFIDNCASLEETGKDVG
jgi:hypothetical protein